MVNVKSFLGINAKIVWETTLHNTGLATGFAIRSYGITPLPACCKHGSFLSGPIVRRVLKAWGIGGACASRRDGKETVTMRSRKKGWRKRTGSCKQINHLKTRPVGMGLTFISHTVHSFKPVKQAWSLVWNNSTPGPVPERKRSFLPSPSDRFLSKAVFPRFLCLPVPACWNTCFAQGVIPAKVWWRDFRKNSLTYLETTWICIILSKRLSV